jgi:hypothetical protein
MVKLKNIASVLSGVAVQESLDGMARFVRLSDLSDLKAGRMPMLIKGEVPAVARAQAIESGDLLIGARGSTTEVYLATEPVIGAYISLDLYLARPDVAQVDPEYLAAFISLPITQAAFVGNKQGSGLARLPKDALEAVSISLPPIPQQRVIAEFARCLRDEADLLARLSALHSVRGSEALMRAIRAVSQNS